MNYEDLMNNIFELSKDFVVVEGSIDIEIYEARKNDSFYRTREVGGIYSIMGSLDEEMFRKNLLDSDWIVDTEGHYTFRAILKYESAECGDYGRVILPGYYDILHCDLKFEETFIQRIRNESLDQLLFDNTLSDLFI